MIKGDTGRALLYCTVAGFWMVESDDAGSGRVYYTQVMSTRTKTLQYSTGL
jgi:hypothetical protein